MLRFPADRLMASVSSSHDLVSVAAFLFFIVNVEERKSGKIEDQIWFYLEIYDFTVCRMP